MTRRTFRNSAIAAAMTLAIGCSALYRTTETYQVDPVTGKTNAVAVAVGVNPNVVAGLQTVAANASFAGPFAPLVAPAAALVLAILGAYGTIWQNQKQKAANTMLTAVVNGVENAATANPTTGAAVKTAIAQASKSAGVAAPLDAVVQAITNPQN